MDKILILVDFIMKLCQGNVLYLIMELMVQVISVVKKKFFYFWTCSMLIIILIIFYDIVAGNLYNEENIKDFARVVKGGTKGDGVDLVTADGVSSLNYIW